jgi:hypothetical protein
MEMAVLIAAITPEEHILNHITDAAQELRLFPQDEEKRDALRMHIIMWLLKEKSGGNIEGAMKFAEEMKDTEKKLSVFKTTDN